MRPLTRERLLDEVEETWLDDRVGVVAMIEFLDQYFDDDLDMDNDEMEFFESHINEERRVTKDIFLNIVDEWTAGEITIVTMVDFLDNCLEQPEFDMDEEHDSGYGSL